MSYFITITENNIKDIFGRIKKLQRKYPHYQSKVKYKSSRKLNSIYRKIKIYGDDMYSKLCKNKLFYKEIENADLIIFENFLLKLEKDRIVLDSSIDENKGMYIDIGSKIKFKNNGFELQWQWVLVNGTVYENVIFYK